LVREERSVLFLLKGGGISRRARESSAPEAQRRERTEYRFTEAEKCRGCSLNIHYLTGKEGGGEEKRESGC